MEQQYKSGYTRLSAAASPLPSRTTSLSADAQGPASPYQGDSSLSEEDEPAHAALIAPRRLHPGRPDSGVGQGLCWRNMWHALHMNWAPWRRSQPARFTSGYLTLIPLSGGLGV
jgi:hypothetical protein